MKLYTAQEVAELVGVHHDTVRRWARTGRIRVVVLPGGGLRFTQNTVDRLTSVAVLQDTG